MNTVQISFSLPSFSMYRIENMKYHKKEYLEKSEIYGMNG
jgi:hypothetical protein